MPSNHIILCHPLLLLPSIFPSIRVFFPKVLALHSRWPKYWSFSFIISPSNEYSGLISFRIDWFDLLAIQGTLKTFLQHHSSDQFFGASVFYCPTLTSIHDYWKKSSFDYAEFCRQIKIKHLKTLNENLKDSNLRLRDRFHIFLYKNYFSYITENGKLQRMLATYVTDKK